MIPSYYKKMGVNPQEEKTIQKCNVRDPQAERDRCVEHTPL